MSQLGRAGHRLRVLGMDGSGPCCPLPSDLNFSEDPQLLSQSQVTGQTAQKRPSATTQGAYHQPLAPSLAMLLALVLEEEALTGSWARRALPSALALCQAAPLRAHPPQRRGFPRRQVACVARACIPYQRQQPLPHWRSAQCLNLCSQTSGSAGPAPLGLTFCGELQHQLWKVQWERGPEVRVAGTPG